MQLRAYKVLNRGRSEFTGCQWPLPTEAGPGDWLTAEGPLELCVNGIHASTLDQLPQWLGRELWELEVGGQVVETEPALVARRARLIRRVDEWDEPARVAFASACEQRARAIAERYPPGRELLTGKIEPFTPLGMAAAVGYWTALLSAESATGRRAGPDYDVAFARERATQAAWLRDELGLGA